MAAWISLRSMNVCAFRFAVQASPQDGAQWLATARRAEELGYATLMMPDGMQLLSPLPALALAAGTRADSIEFESPIFVVGDEAPPWIQRFLQTDLATLVERDSLLILRGSLRQMADELLLRRDEIGISYVSVNAAFLEQFAPVVELLAGQ